jgi:hypothetical protein
VWYHFFAVIATLFATRGTINKIRHRKMLSKTPEMIGKRTENRAWENIVKEYKLCGFL